MPWHCDVVLSVPLAKRKMELHGWSQLSACHSQFCIILWGGTEQKWFPATWANLGADITGDTLCQQQEQVQTSLVTSRLRGSRPCRVTQWGMGTAALRGLRLPGRSAAGSCEKQLLHSAGDSPAQEFRPCLPAMLYFKNIDFHQKQRIHTEDPPQEVWRSAHSFDWGGLGAKAEHTHPQHT